MTKITIQNGYPKDNAITFYPIKFRISPNYTVSLYVVHVIQCTFLPSDVTTLLSSCSTVFCMKTFTNVTCGEGKGSDVWRRRDWNERFLCTGLCTSGWSLRIFTLLLFTSVTYFLCLFFFFDFLLSIYQYHLFLLSLIFLKSCFFLFAISHFFQCNSRLCLYAALPTLCRRYYLFKRKTASFFIFLHLCFNHTCYILVFLSKFCVQNMTATSVQDSNSINSIKM